MTIIRPTRRGLITGLASLLVAPAIVRASSLMPVKVMTNSTLDLHWQDMTWAAQPSDALLRNIRFAVLYDDNTGKVLWRGDLKPDGEGNYTAGPVPAGGFLTLE